MLALLISLFLVFLGAFMCVLPYGIRMLGVLVIFAGVLVFLGGFARPGRHPSKKRRNLAAGIAAFTVIAILLLDIPIIRDARTDAQPGADYLIVFGAGLFGDQPSRSLRDRLEAAALYLSSSPNTRVIVSGGKGPDEAIPEAEAMRTYLLQAGIKEDRILVEDRSTSTKENIQFSKALLQSELSGTEQEIGDLSLVVISSEYHLHRIRYLAKKAGLSVRCIAAPTSLWFLKLNYFIREIPAMAKSILFD